MGQWGSQGQKKGGGGHIQLHFFWLLPFLFWASGLHKKMAPVFTTGPRKKHFLKERNFFLVFRKKVSGRWGGFLTTRFFKPNFPIPFMGKKPCPPKSPLSQKFFFGQISLVKKLGFFTTLGGPPSCPKPKLGPLQLQKIFGGLWPGGGGLFLAVFPILGGRRNLSKLPPQKTRPTGKMGEHPRGGQKKNPG